MIDRKKLITDLIIVAVVLCVWAAGCYARWVPTVIRDYPVGGLKICNGDSCTVIPRGSILRVPTQIPAGHWNAVIAHETS